RCEYVMTLGTAGFGLFPHNRIAQESIYSVRFFFMQKSLLSCVKDLESPENFLFNRWKDLFFLKPHRAGKCRNISFGIFPENFVKVVISWGIQTMSGWILRRCTLPAVQPEIGRAHV